MSPSTPLVESESSLVRVDHQGQRLGLEWGRKSRGDTGKWAALGVISFVIFFILLLAAGAIEGSNQTLADVVGFSGLGVLILGGGSAVVGGVRANGGLKHQGRVSVNEKVIETSLRGDPYVQKRAKATDAFPQFRDHLPRSSVVGVSYEPHNQAQGRINDKKFQVLAELDNGVQYVIAFGVTEVVASEVVNELRAHLELPAEGKRATRAESDAALSELHDAVTEYRKGPVIGADEAPQRQDRRGLS